MFFVAPTDLAQTMGHLGNPGHPEVQRAIEGAITKILSAGRVAGTLVNDENVARFLGQGVRYTMTSWNAWVTQGAAAFLEKVAGAKI